MVTVVTKDNFQSEILDCTMPVLVDFWATWCGPCKMVAPVVDQIAGENDDFKVCKIDVDEEGALAQQFGIMSIPTLMVFRDGKVADQAVGVRPKSMIEAML